MKKDDVKMKTVTVAYSGSVGHEAGERQSRYIKGDQQRDELRKLFNKGPDKPSVIYQQKKRTGQQDRMCKSARNNV